MTFDQAESDPRYQEWIEQKMRARGLSSPPSTVEPPSTPSVKPPARRRWYCGMCERLTSRGGDCRRCGFDLERWPGGEL